MAKLTDKQKLFKYFNITKNEIFCKYNTYIQIDINDYKVKDEEAVDTVDSDEIDYVYNVPGIFDAFIIDENETISFAFPFIVNLIKTNNSDIKNNILTIYYEPNDKFLMIHQKKADTDLKVLTKLLDNGVKYLRNDIDRLVLSTWSEIAYTKRINLHIIELIYTVLYGEESENGFIPTRLGSQKYSKENALNPMESAHNFGTLNALNYGYMNEAILKNVTRHPDFEPKKSDMEKIISSDYHELDFLEKQI